MSRRKPLPHAARCGVERVVRQLVRENLEARHPFGDEPQAPAHRRAVARLYLELNQTPYSSILSKN